jgi:hypothetical protein
MAELRSHMKAHDGADNYEDGILTLLATPNENRPREDKGKKGLVLSRKIKEGVFFNSIAIEEDLIDDQIDAMGEKNSSNPIEETGTIDNLKELKKLYEYVAAKKGMMDSRAMNILEEIGKYIFIVFDDPDLYYAIKRLYSCHPFILEFKLLKAASECRENNKQAAQILIKELERDRKVNGRKFSHVYENFLLASNSHLVIPKKRHKYGNRLLIIS